MLERVAASIREVKSSYFILLFQGGPGDIPADLSFQTPGVEIAFSCYIVEQFPSGKILQYMQQTGIGGVADDGRDPVFIFGNQTGRRAGPDSMKNMLMLGLYLYLR